MEYYIDIHLLLDTEVHLGFIWQKVYQQIHLALVENKTSDGNSAVAISFPEYDNKTYPLGNILRLCAASPSQLEQLDLSKWLRHLSDYSNCSSINEVPSSATHARFKRMQFSTNIERLARRRSKRKNESLEQALAHYDSFTDKHSRLPYINMNSLSQGGTFRLFIKKETLEHAEAGIFNCYGLSSTASVPWF